MNLLGQFLHTAVSSLCHTANVAPSLVGTVEDVRDLIAFRLNLGGANRLPPPALAVGWRAEVVGHAIEELLGDGLSVFPRGFWSTILTFRSLGEVQDIHNYIWVLTVVYEKRGAWVSSEYPFPKAYLLTNDWRSWE